MPKQTTSFIKGKMNKDLDPRIIPVGEYLDAENIMVGQSETSDVGSVEALKDNLKLTSGTVATEDYGYVIGYCLDSENDKVYYFVTKFNSQGGSAKPESSDKSAIIQFNFFNNSFNPGSAEYNFSFTSLPFSKSSTPVTILPNLAKPAPNTVA